MLSPLSPVLRWRRQDDVWHPMLGGALTGAAVLLESPKRVSELMLFCMSRSVEVCFLLAERHGLVPRFQYGEAVVFCAAMGMLLGIDRQDFKPVYRAILDFLFGREVTPAAANPAETPTLPAASPTRTAASTVAASHLVKP